LGHEGRAVALAACRKGTGRLVVLALCVLGAGCMSRWTNQPPTAPGTRPAAEMPPQPRAGRAETDSRSVPPAVAESASTASAAASASAAAGAPARLGGAKVGQSSISTECLAQIEAFAELRTGNRVMLGQAAFADSDQLLLTRAPGRGSDGRRLDGRAAAAQPVVFNLLRGAQGCTIRLREAGTPPPPSALPQSASLPACTCTVLSEQTR
jgi:hypothetical protein